MFRIPSLKFAEIFFSSTDSGKWKDLVKGPLDLSL